MTKYTTVITFRAADQGEADEKAQQMAQVWAGAYVLPESTQPLPDPIAPAQWDGDAQGYDQDPAETPTKKAVDKS